MFGPWSCASPDRSRIFKPGSRSFLWSVSTALSYLLREVVITLELLTAKVVAEADMPRENCKGGKNTHGKLVVIWGLEEAEGDVGG